MPIQPLPLSHEYAWNSDSSRYIDLTTGQFVSRALVAQELEKVIAASESNIIAVTQSLLEGTVTLPEWQLAMERELRTLHTASAAAALGGWEQVSQSDWGAVGALLRKQYQWLDDFAIDIAIGTQKMNGMLLVRAKLYAQSGRGTYEEMRRRAALNAKFTEERRLLSPAEHCSDCVMEAAMGWQPLGTLRQIGDSQCRTNCKCRFDFR